MEKESIASVKIENSNLTPRIKNLKQKHWIKASERLIYGLLRVEVKVHIELSTLKKIAIGQTVKI